MKVDKILLAHGGGGQLTDELIRNYFLPRFSNKALEQLGDSAKIKIDSDSICFSTDSYVIKPIFFNGGDIGKLSVCGTINDLAVSGARPLALSLALILETGFDIADLEKILDSISRTASENNVQIVTGDTKTVEVGAADKIFINTAGIGIPIKGCELSLNRIQAGDIVLVSGTIGDHGMTITSHREGIKFDTPLHSDCAALCALICPMLEKFQNQIKFMRDPTRGGLAATLNEIVRDINLSIELNETEIPITPTVQAAADMLGFDVLNIANEGKFVAIVSPEAAGDCLNLCKQHTLGKDAKIIGKVISAQDVPVVELITKIGGRRIVQMPYGQELPRIC